MSKQKLTLWFRGFKKPERAGVYERDELHIGQYSYWNGLYWGLGCSDIESASEPYNRTRPSQQQEARWRGLASDPKAKP